MMSRIAFLFASVAFFLSTSGLFAQSCCEECGCASCQLVTKTIMVPCVITETRLKSCVVKSMQEREETYTVFQRVPVTQKFMKETCYLDDEVKTKEITQQCCKRVTNPVVRTYAVRVPYTQIEEKMVQREVCTECGKVCIEEPCSCQVTRQRTELRSETCQREDVVMLTTKKEISYCVKVPKKHEEFCAEETVYKLQPVEKKRTVCVCVPEIVKKPYTVEVVKMLPKTICICERCCKLH